MKTVRVRIAVVVGEGGGWNASGWHSARDEDKMGCAFEGLDEGGQAHAYWLEADLQVPDVATVEAAVVERVQ